MKLFTRSIYVETTWSNDQNLRIIPITPSGLDDVFASLVTIATALGEEEKAYSCLSALHSRIDKIIDKLRAAKAKPKRVMLIEWLEPVYNCGHSHPGHTLEIELQ